MIEIQLLLNPWAGGFTRFNVAVNSYKLTKPMNNNDGKKENKKKNNNFFCRRVVYCGVTKVFSTCGFMCERLVFPLKANLINPFPIES